MKKYSFLFIALMTVVLSTSCVSSKKIVYFQGADHLYTEAQNISQQFDLRIKPADNILIKISSSNPELLEVFANSVILGNVGRASQTSSTSNINSQMGNIYSYTVNNDGEVILPLLGPVSVGGKTAEEASKVIAQAIRDAQLVNDPEVTVRFMNARVSVLGGVARPGVVNLTSERNSIVDVLAQCGDIADDGLKTNIKLFREVNGVRTMYTLDLTDVDVFNSPAFYVQQNDMIYVQPNKSKNIKNSAFYTFLGAGASMWSMVSSVLSTILVIQNISDK